MDDIVSKINAFFDSQAKRIHQATPRSPLTNYTHVAGWKFSDDSGCSSPDYHGKDSVLGFVNFYTNSSTHALEFLPKTRSDGMSPASDIKILLYADNNGMLKHNVEQLSSKSLDATIQFVAEFGHTYKSLQQEVYNQQSLTR